MSAPSVRLALRMALHLLDAEDCETPGSPGCPFAGTDENEFEVAVAAIKAALATPDPAEALAEAVRAYAPHRVVSVDFESDIAYERRRMRWIAVQEALATYTAGREEG